MKGKGRSSGLVILAVAATLASAAQWVPVEHHPSGGRGYDITMTREDGHRALYACVAPAGLNSTPRIYKSTTDGSSWSQAYVNPDLLTVRAVPTNNSHAVYAGGKDMGVLKSTDEGGTWLPCTVDMGSADIRAIDIADSDPSTVYAAGGTWMELGGRVFRTTDAGDTWADVTPTGLPIPQYLVVNDVAVHPTVPNRVLLGCGSGSPPAPYRGIYATTDGGTSWSQRYESCDVYSVAISNSNSAVAYAGGDDFVLKSTDGGQNWSATQSAPPAAVYSLVIHPDDEDQVYANANGVWYTSDGGGTWEPRVDGMLLKNTAATRICMDIDYPDSIFSGERDAGFYRTSNGGESWEQASAWVPCRDVHKIITTENDGYFWVYDTDLAVDVSTDGGGRWTTTLPGATEEGDMVHPVADTVLIARSYGPLTLDPGTRFVISRSTDRGFSWYGVYEAWNEWLACCFYQFGVAPTDPKRVYGTTVLSGVIAVLRSDDCGSNWYIATEVSCILPLNSVAVTGNPDKVYFGCLDGQIGLSKDGGRSVQPWGELPDPVEIRRLIIDVNDERLMYAATPSGVYRSEDYGESWVQANDGLSEIDMREIVMDPNGSCLWAAAAGSAGAGPHVYVSDDGALSWSVAVDGLPPDATVHSLSFGSDRYLHAGTSVGVFTLDVREEGLTSPLATYPNWGRKLAREPDTDIFHLVYTRSDTAFYSQSTDGGETWSDAEPIGAGRYPAVVLNWVIGVEALAPWVVYLTPEGSIMRAIRVAPGTWDKAVVFHVSSGARAGAPSLAASLVACPPPAAFVTYPVYVAGSPGGNFVYFNTFTAYNVSQPEILDAAGSQFCYGASVVENPGTVVHVAWIRGQSVYYRERSPLAVWSDPVPLSSPLPSPFWVTEPASNPSMEAYGDSVFCVWRGPKNNQGEFPGEVWRRSRWLPDPFYSWKPVWPPSQFSDSESNYPVMTTAFATVWHEHIATPNDDVWGTFLWRPAPEPFFETPMLSRYPHVDGYWIPDSADFACNTVWTERVSAMPPTYAVQFGVHHHVPEPGLLKGNDYEPATYYAAELGQPVQSPYCLSRGGYAKFESWDVDTSRAILQYQLPYLNPLRNYKLRAVIYHEGSETWSVDVRCDSGPWFRVNVGPRVPDTAWVPVPKRLYKTDARIALELARVTGDFASLAELKLFQVEDRTRAGDGVQSMPAAAALDTRLLDCAPNPFGGATAIKYQVGCASPVVLTVHDASGRLVRRLESGPRPAGRYVARWDGADNRGRTVPAGVYFVRLSARGVVSTGHLNLAR